MSFPRKPFLTEARAAQLSEEAILRGRIVFRANGVEGRSMVA